MGWECDYDRRIHGGRIVLEMTAWYIQEGSKADNIKADLRR